MFDKIKNFFSKRHNIIFVNQNWEPLFYLNLTEIPRNGEYIYINDTDGYYYVKFVVHNFKNNQKIIVISPLIKK